MQPSEIADHLTQIWWAGVKAVQSEQLVASVIETTDSSLHIAGIEATPGAQGRLLVVGAGKAGTGMAKGVEAAIEPSQFADRLSGWVNVPEDCIEPMEKITLHAGRPAGVNEPTSAGVEGTNRILELVSNATEQDVCLVLISGGGSALLPAPKAPLSWEQKRDVTRFLMTHEATISELNTVRKQLSAVKGGGLARACNAGKMIVLIISDVMGDPLDVIASGPTVPDSTTAADALKVLAKCGAQGESWYPTLEQVLKPSACSMTTQSAEHWSNEQGCEIHNCVVGSLSVAMKAASEKAVSLGYEVVDRGDRCEGNARELGHQLITELSSQKSDRPVCLIAGGETTVHLAPEASRGKGGRNQEMALATVETIPNAEHWEKLGFLSGGTDGEDGPTDAAGGVITQAVIEQIESLKADVKSALDRSDAYTLLGQVGGLLKTGPTHTNVMDLQVGIRQ